MSFQTFNVTGSDISRTFTYVLEALVFGMHNQGNRDLYQLQLAAPRPERSLFLRSETHTLFQLLISIMKKRAVSGV